MTDSRRSSVNGTSTQDEGDENTPRRPTRLRIGPLPKNSPDNPLFPPLPPKVPRQSMNGKKPKSESLEPPGYKKEGSVTSSLRNEVVGEAEEGDTADRDREIETPITPTPGHVQPELLNNVTHSNTPPTARAENETAKREEKGDNSALDEREDDGDWAGYARRQRQARGFGKGSFNALARQSFNSSTNRNKEVDQAEPVSGEKEEASEQGIRPPKLERMASLGGSSVLTMDNEDDIEEEELPEPLEESFEEKADPVEAPMDLEDGMQLDPPEESVIDSETIENVKQEELPQTETEVVPQPDQIESETIVVAEEQEDQGEKNSDVTRCVCGREDIDVWMISCDSCWVWQHGVCVGIEGDWDAPQEYWCDLCKPHLHSALRRFTKSRKQRSLPFTPPSDQDLLANHLQSDRCQPSQSKRWDSPKSAQSSKRSVPAPAVVEKKTTSSGRSQRGAKAPSPVPVAAPVGDSRRRGGTARAERQEAHEPPHSSKSGSMSAKRRPSVIRRGSSETSEDSGLQGGGQTSAAKKRSTMNSRDAAYEAAIAASLAEAGIPSVPAAASVGSASTGEKTKGTRKTKRTERISEEMEVDDDPSAKKSVRGLKRGRPEDGEEESDDEKSARKGKKKKEDEEEDPSKMSALALANSKSKHPNQYTYRPKGGQLGGPQPPKMHPSPSKKPPTAAEARKFANANVRAGTPVNAQAATIGTVGTLSWGLPDHLVPFAHVLPTIAPEPLELMTPRPINNKGIITPDHLNEERQTHFEQPSKVKYPGKRMTVGEMKKRVRSVLEYVGRIQIEEVTRGERAKMLGLDKLALDPQHADLSTDSTGQVSRSMLMMDELTRELIKFQEIFEGNGIVPFGNIDGGEHHTELDR